MAKGFQRRQCVIWNVQQFKLWLQKHFQNLHWVSLQRLHRPLEVFLHDEMPLQAWQFDEWKIWLQANLVSKSADPHDLATVKQVPDFDEKTVIMVKAYLMLFIKPCAQVEAELQCNLGSHLFISHVVEFKDIHSRSN